MVIAVRARSPRINVVVACTNRKSLPIPASRQLRRVTAVDPTRRLRDWTRRLDDKRADRLPATDLYAGESWDVARSLLDRSASDSVALWICSAGLGLVASGAAIPPYSATFEHSHPDGTPGGATGATNWWSALGSWKGLNPGPRTLRALAREDRSARLIVVLSPPYLKACRSDLAAAASELKDDTQLSVISAGTKRDASLARYLLPVDARLQAKVGGTKHSLNIRVAQALLDSGAETHNAMHDRLVRWLRSQPPLPRFDRRVVSDDQVRAFIRKRLTGTASLSYSRLLREYRSAGFACEQGRFAGLFEEARVSYV